MLMLKFANAQIEGHSLDILRMTKGYIALGRWPRAIQPLVIPRTLWQIFQSIAPATIK
jgi:hypothetical protein